MKPTRPLRKGDGGHGRKKEPPSQTAGGKSRAAPATPAAPKTVVPVDSKPFNAAAMKQFTDAISLDVDLETARSLDLRNKGFRTLPSSLHVLLKSVRKLDLSGNNLTDLSPLASLPMLSNLTVSNNPNVKSLASLHCTRLVVLSVASCGLTSLKGVECCADTLRTLIANDNHIQLQTPEEQRRASTLPAEVRAAPTLSVAVGNYLALAALAACETVVLTRNPTLCTCYPPHDTDKEEAPKRRRHTTHSQSASDEDAADEEEEEEDDATKTARQQAAKQLAAAHPLSVFEQLTHLKKLSLSDCNLTCLPARWFLPMVTELRLAKNALTTLRPEGVIARSLKMLDVSHNQLTSVATLRRCHYVQKLSIRGNPFVELYTARDQDEEANVAAEKKSAASVAGTQEESHAKAEAAASAVPVSLQRSLKRMLTQLETIDGQALLSEKELAFRRRPRQSKAENTEGTEAGENSVPRAKIARVEKHDSHAMRAEDKGSDDDEASLSEASPPARANAAAAVKPKPTRDAQTLAKVRAEADEKDIVVEAPEAVVKESHASIVRRERSTVVPKKGVVLSGEAAVAQLLKQKQASQGW